MVIQSIEVSAEVQDAAGEWRKVSFRVSSGSALGRTLSTYAADEFRISARENGWEIPREPQPEPVTCWPVCCPVEPDPRD